MKDCKLSESPKRTALYPPREALWERPFTAKRYLHPPRAEQMVTMWPACTVLYGDVFEGEDRDCRSSAFRLLAGREAMEIPFEQVRYCVREDGIPIHTLRHELKNFSLEMESFCSVSRNPAAYTRVAVTNLTGAPIQDCVCIMPRTGSERHLTGMDVDGYCHQNANPDNWGFLRSDWRYTPGCLSDGQYQIRLQTEGFSPLWQGDAPGLLWRQRHLLRLDFSLAPAESKTFFLGFCKGECPAFDFTAEKKKAEQFWSAELSKIKLWISQEPEMKSLQKNLVSQLLQMFSYPIGKSCLLPRQGGLQRAVWPVEALEFLIALDRVGDFYDYTEAAYDTFFRLMQRKEGEDRGAILNLKGQKWASNTGGALWGVARHILFRGDKQVFLRFREPMLSGFEWMQRQRDKTRDGRAIGQGIFPPMQATDWAGEYQSWCWTDGNNVIGYQWLAEVFERFQDPRAGEIRNAYQEYMECMRRILRRQAEQNPAEEELHLTNRLGYEPADPQVGAVGNGALNLLRSGVLRAGSREARLVENYYRNRGYGQHGLMGLMGDGLLLQGDNADYWAGHTWYTSAPDICWFYAWLESGQKEKAKQTLEAQLKYAMTPEYYMCERYADNDPYFTPWLPNASANGRTLMMLLDYYNG